MACIPDRIATRMRVVRKANPGGFSSTGEAISNQLLEILLWTVSSLKPPATPATTSCKIVETLPLKTAFLATNTRRIYNSNLSHFPPPSAISMLTVEVFSNFFVLLATMIRKGGGGGAAVWKITGKLMTPQEGEESPLIL